MSLKNWAGVAHCPLCHWLGGSPFRYSWCVSQQSLKAVIYLVGVQRKTCFRHHLDRANALRARSRRGAGVCAGPASGTYRRGGKLHSRPQRIPIFITVSTPLRFRFALDAGSFWRPPYALAMANRLNGYLFLADLELLLEAHVQLCMDKLFGFKKKWQ